MKKRGYKKIVSGILFGVITFIVGGFKIVYGAGVFNLAFSAVIGKLAAGVGYILGVIASAVFWLGGVFVEFAMNINADILSRENAVVQSGWQVVLNFANLGFVLAIIVIAFATILRRESYAMKQTLWKLIVAALLVNFSLVIAGAFISVSDIASQYFLDGVTLSGDNSFPVLLGKALGVQAFLDAKSGPDGLAGAVDGLGKPMLTLITSVLFTAAFTFIGGLTLFALAIMLLIRYVFLSILLIISPIVWLFWIFPATQSYWGKWWNHFFRWTFFQPIVLFFLFLTVSTLDQMNNFFVENIGKDENSAAIVSGVFTFGVDTVGKFTAIIGLMLGGLIAANSLSIHFSGTAYGWAQTAGKAFGAWSGRKGKALGSAPFRAQWTQKKIEGLQKYGADKGFLGKTVSAPIRRLGTVLGGAGVRTGEKLVSDAGERLKKRFSSDKDLANTFESLSRDEKIAAAQRLAKNGSTGLLGEDVLKRFIGNEKTKNMFERHGAGNDYNNFEKAAGMNKEMVNAGADKDKLKKAAEKFYKTFGQKDFDKINKDVFFDDKKYANADVHLKALIDTNPGAFGKLFPKLKSGDLDGIEDRIIKVVLPDNIEIKVKGVKQAFKKSALLAGNKDELGRVFKKYTEQNMPVFEKAYHKHLGNRLLGFTPFEKGEKEET